MRKLLLLAAMSALLTACGAKNSETSTTSDASTTPPAPAAAPDTKELDTATQESAGSEASTGEDALKSIVAMPENVQLPTGRWKAGTHYKPVVPAQNTNVDPGQVEVLEFMWLGCNHCADLEPTVVAWAKQKPDYVKFVQEHVLWNSVTQSHAKLLYTLQTLNRDDLVPKAFDEIHVRKNNLVSLKGDEAETLSLQLAFAKANGVSEADFKREYNGFAVSSRLKRSAEINSRYRIESVPIIVINGKYETDLGMAGGKKELIQLINDLAAVEKKGR